MKILVGSEAVTHWYNGFREPKDVDWFSPEKVVSPDGRKFETFWHEDIEKNIDTLLKYCSEYHGYYVATIDFLYTLKVSHAFWAGRNGKWKQHMYDIRWMQTRTAAKFIPELYDIFYPIWEQRFSPKKTSLTSDSTAEVWKEYPHDTRYRISTHGRVIGVHGKLVGGSVHKAGKNYDKPYRRFYISTKQEYAHKLVMQTFVGDIPPGQEIRHVDDNGLNNRLDNLMFGTKSQNAADSIRNGTFAEKERNGMAVLTEESVIAIRERYAKGGVTHRQLAEEFGLSHNAVGKAIRGDTWKVRGEFFSESVDRKYHHDSIHASVAYGDHPLYVDILKNGESVKTDWSKFEALNHRDKIRLVREEVFATALERQIIPSDYKASPRGAYGWALHKTITSFWKGRWALWAVLHYNEVCTPDIDYVKKHLDNKDKLILL